MESIFKFKKPDKKKVGDFDSDDKHEWQLLVKPQIGNVTLFVHFHKLWLVEEKPEVQEDEANGIEYQPGVQRVPVCEVYYGFIKDDKFVVERQNRFQERIDELAQRRLNTNLQNFLEQGYTKDWNNYKGDEPIVPNYYGHQEKPGLNPKIFGGKRPHQILKNVMQSVQLGGNQPNSNPNPQNP